MYSDVGNIQLVDQVCFSCYCLYAMEMYTSHVTCIACKLLTFFENKIMGIFFSLNFTMFPAVNTTVLSLNGMAPQEVREKYLYIKQCSIELEIPVVTD